MKDLIAIDSISQIHKLFGLAPPTHPLISIVDLSQIQVRNPLVNKRLAIGLYSLTLKTKFAAPFLYGREYFDFDSGTLFACAPGQVIMSEMEYQAGDIEGWALYIHPDFLLGTSLADSLIQYGFFDYDIKEALHVSDTEKQTLFTVVSQLGEELGKNIDEFSHPILIASIALLMTHVDRFFHRQFITRKPANRQIVEQVRAALEAYYAKPAADISGLPTVNEIANQVFLSPKYMSDLLKNETGYGAQDTIHHYILNLAKHRLLQSQDSVTQVGLSLGFEYSQYFSRMFKKHVGLTPSEFRKRH